MCVEKIVHVQLHRVEEVLHALQLRDVAVDQVLVSPADGNLPRDGDLAQLLVADRRHLRIVVVEDKCDARLGHASLARLVDELVETVGAHLRPW